MAEFIKHVFPRLVNLQRPTRSGAGVTLTVGTGMLTVGTGMLTVGVSVGISVGVSVGM